MRGYNPVRWTWKGLETLVTWDKNKNTAENPPNLPVKEFSDEGVGSGKGEGETEEIRAIMAPPVDAGTDRKVYALENVPEYDEESFEEHNNCGTVLRGNGTDSSLYLNNYSVFSNFFSSSRSSR